MYYFSSHTQFTRSSLQAFTFQIIQEGLQPTGLRPPCGLRTPTVTNGFQKPGHNTQHGRNDCRQPRRHAYIFCTLTLDAEVFPWVQSASSSTVHSCKNISPAVRNANVGWSGYIFHWAYADTMDSAHGQPSLSRKSSALALETSELVFKNANRSNTAAA